MTGIMAETWTWEEGDRLGTYSGDRPAGRLNGGICSGKEKNKNNSYVFDRIN